MRGPSRRRRLLILAICCMSMVIVGLDNTIVNVALPSIQRDLHASVSGLQWVVDGYTLVLASLLVLSGSTADRFGRRITFQAGLATFTIGSLLCSLAPSLGWLVAVRMLQAVGGSMLNPVAMSIITNTFTDRAERARAIGVWGAAVGVSLALGPVVGGLLIASVGWRGIFWVNIPVGVAAIVLTAMFVPESKATHPRRLDAVGQVRSGLVQDQRAVYESYAPDASAFGADQTIASNDPGEVAERLVGAMVEAGANALNLRVQLPGMEAAQVR